MQKLLCPIVFGLLTILLSGCSDENANANSTDTFVRAADLSFLPEIEQSETIYYDNGQPKDAIQILHDHGCNTIRLRLWKNPPAGHSGMAEVKQMAMRARVLGMQVWLSVHFSDTWADPGQQMIPQEWQVLDFDGLKAEVSGYTSEIIQQIHPDIFQIGNETNDGFLWPMGQLSQNPLQCHELFSAVSASIRAQSPQTKIMIHYAGTSGAVEFFDSFEDIDYDSAGLSYYPVWHGTDLDELSSVMALIQNHTGKEILIAETAYPFTLGYDDWTNNIVGLESQLVPGYPATPNGQKQFLQSIRNLVEWNPNGNGFCYWGGEWVAFRGPESTSGSPYENQALFDFDHNGLSVLDVFER
ncbi:glycoside hydrolase family 53 protein [Flavobacterium silvaticum]|uniref:Arabinogalactan endo-beta-1,4-galactanase n=1 Tax=Flavobacterium silvaticum TaxID=1852020 RepID=A0A972FN25_9FLAO|nr:glycosyl hydrolase 53 family protein [Flavobacterium silvaticum]NMH28712.1 arabinogalactan endo-1,4-beta-galactosidase [Flavobacterium silvaticum]